MITNSQSQDKGARVAQLILCCILTLSPVILLLLFGKICRPFEFVVIGSMLLATIAWYLYLKEYHKNSDTLMFGMIIINGLLGMAACFCRALFGMDYYPPLSVAGFTDMSTMSYWQIIFISFSELKEYYIIAVRPVFICAICLIILYCGMVFGQKINR